MADKFTASAAQLKPDHRTNSKLASKFINCLMHDGKKSVAMNVFYDAMDIIVKKLPDDEATRVFTEAVENVRPSIEVRSKRVGGATYQVPTPVNPRRQQTLAIRWLIEAVHVSLAEELMAAYRREGAAMTKRENVHRMADANKAFAHFAW
jgi:small subunit ribosomal protein S7